MTLNKNSVEAYLNFTSSITYGETVSLLWAGEGDKCESYRFRTNTDAFERIYASRPAPLARFRRWPSEKKKSNYDALVNIAAGVLHVMARKAVARWLFYLCRCLLSPTRDPSLLFFATDQPPPRAVSGLPPATRARVRKRPSAVVTFANRQQRNCSPEVAHHSDYANDAEGRPRAGGVTGARAGSGRRNKKHPPLCAGNILRANVRANFNNAFCIRGVHVGGTEGSRFPVFKACPNGFITVLQCAWDVLRSRICQ